MLNVYRHYDDFRTPSFRAEARMLCGKDGEIEQRHRVKNLLPGWHLPAFPTTVIDPSLVLRMTLNVFHHGDA